MKAFHIYDKNNDNFYTGYVVAENEVRAAKLVNEKHPHFSDNELEIVWNKKGDQGQWTSKAFGLEEVGKVQEVLNYSNVIK